MKFFNNLGLIIVILLLAVPVCGADDVQKGFAFGKMEIFPLENGINMMRAADINKDGLQDLLVVNNRKARIEILVQRSAEEIKNYVPETDPEDINKLFTDPRFKRESYFTEKRITSLETGDFNSDGRVDLAFYGEPKELIVVYQDEAGLWSETKKFRITDGNLNTGNLTAADINNDGRTDILMLGARFIYFIKQDSGGELLEPENLPIGSSVPQGVMTADFNGDKLKDIIAIIPNDPYPVRLRLQEKVGGFGPESRFELPSPRGIDIQDLDKDGRSEILMIQEKSGRLQILEYAEKRAGEKTGLQLGDMVRYPLPVDTRARDRGYAFGDLNRDKRTDIVVSLPDKGQISVYYQDKKDGIVKSEEFASYLEVGNMKIADADDDGKNELYLLSKKEKTLGVSRPEKDGSIPFPKLIQVNGTPSCMTSGKLTKKGGDVLLVSVDTDDDRKNVIYKYDKGGMKELFQLDKSNSTPEEMNLADINADGRAELIVFIQYDDLHVYTQDKDGGFKLAVKDNRGRDSKPETLSFADGDGDGHEELLWAQKKFARAFKLEEVKGKNKDDESTYNLAVAAQFNSPSSAPDIAGACAAALSGNREPEIILYNKADHELSVLENDKGKMILVKRIDLGSWDFLGMGSADFDGDGRADIYLEGVGEFGIIYNRSGKKMLSAWDTYETAIPEGKLGYLAAGDVNNDGLTDIVLAETKKHYLDIVSLSKQKKIVKGTRFQVFEEKSYQSNQSVDEPREILCTDMTGDGLTDILIIVHDRVILYPQKN